MKRLLVAKIAFFGICVAGSLSSHAIPITGSIQFIGSATVNNNGLAKATSFTSFDGPGGLPGDPVILGGSQTGVYAFVPASTRVTWHTFNFTSGLTGRVPLWSFEVNGIKCSFEATAITIVQRTDRVVNMVIEGVSHIDGYQDTITSWKVAMTGGASTVTFGAAARVDVNPIVVNAPDSGSTMGLLCGVFTIFVLMTTMRFCGHKTLILRRFNS